MAHPLRTWANKTTGKNSGGLPNVRSADLPEHQREFVRKNGKHPPPVPGNPPSWVDDEASWERAKEIVKKKWGDYDEPWAVVAHVYNNMTGG